MVRSTSAISCIVLASYLLSACGNKDFDDARSRIADKMRDPGSVQFREVKYCNLNPEIVTGEFNAKNGYGAYTGFDRFYASTFAVAVEGDIFFEGMKKQCLGREQ